MNLVKKKEKKNRTYLRRSHKSEMCLFHRSVATKEYFINTNHLEFSLFEINYLPLAKKMGWMWAAQMCQTLSSSSMYKGDQNI